ncbi:lipopolysaccharide biosynthesis protein [Chryseobacterium shigense]|uniref:Glycosyltransferase WbsX n=1 Tax=Chryseobacterium shigense TaxID=297244 RepID=A0A1N7IEQ1_9FLAO|nr:glycoside hydrolase family 99-like domain-containing protein [Chryseobacterium shigense]PQA94345.1 lipopolysaccharide biosynthesis protein [Chryseobacterium shigense]SIS35559.1 Glycosyltransferase WbsX [Chryseobacterium shigense]
MKQIKTLAFYLPQYHPIPENDEWWGKGFTEWTNVGKAKPLFEGHEQPICPGDLGYYDLRVPEVREQQAQMARDYGVHGFIYYHYWFGNGKQLLERIANEVLESGKPDFPFCFCWANETWSGVWHGLENKILAEQVYPTDEDLISHFNYLLPFFKDKRYIKVDNKPVLVVYDPININEKSPEYLEKFTDLAKENGFDGLYLIASNKTEDDHGYKELRYQAKISNAFLRAWRPYMNQKPYISAKQYYTNRLKGILGLKTVDFKKPVDIQNAPDVINDLHFDETDVDTFPCLISNWDNTPRSGNRGIILGNNSPALFEKQVEKAVNFLKDKNYSQKFLVVKSWNEWAEGNILEPDRKNGYGYLEALKKIVSKENGND